jgi:hypothetical protein
VGGIKLQQPRRALMKRTLLSLATATAIVSAATLLPSSANAMGVGTATAIDNALSSITGVTEVPYVCRWRYGYRRCWWVPGARYYYRPYRYRRWRYW